MKTYLLIYHAPDALVESSVEPTAEEMEKGMEPWRAWAAKCGERLMDFGQPLINGVQVKPDGSTSASTREVRGYLILRAGDLDEVTALLDGHPHLDWDEACSIELHEVNPLPGTE